jgi:hypothetical protein
MLHKFIGFFHHSQKYTLINDTTHLMDVNQLFLHQTINNLY